MTLFFLININSLMASERCAAEDAMKIAYSLRDNPEELRTFLEHIGGNFPRAPDIPITAQEREEIPNRTPLSYALQSLNFHHQVQLTGVDILNREPHNPYHVVSVNLGDVNAMDGGVQSTIIHYFNSQPLCNLRELILPLASAVSLIGGIFPSNELEPNQRNKYCSLLRVIINSDDVSLPISEGLLEKIEAHFRNYNFLVRDMQQKSGRLRRSAAFLIVESRVQTAADWVNRNGWLSGRTIKEEATDKLYSIHYRVESPQESAPLIISLRTN